MPFYITCEVLKEILFWGSKIKCIRIYEGWSKSFEIISVDLNSSWHTLWSLTHYFETSTHFISVMKFEYKSTAVPAFLFLFLFWCFCFFYLFALLWEFQNVWVNPRIQVFVHVRLVLPQIVLYISPLHFIYHMSRNMTKPAKWGCAQRRLISAWACAQSDQSLRCPHEESLGP